MKVLLIQNIDKIGRKGELKTVSDGYATNFLLPQRLAVLPTDDLLHKYQKENKLKEQGNKNSPLDQDDFFKKLHNQTLTFTAPSSDKGTLFKAVTKKDIVEKVSKQFGVLINEKMVSLSEPLKELGLHQISLTSGQFKCDLKININKK